MVLKLYKTETRRRLFRPLPISIEGGFSLTPAGLDDDRVRQRAPTALIVNDASNAPREGFAALRSSDRGAVQHRAGATLRPVQRRTIIARD
jgi:hypothetical protein